MEPNNHWNSIERMSLYKHAMVSSFWRQMNVEVLAFVGVKRRVDKVKIRGLDFKSWSLSDELCCICLDSWMVAKHIFNRGEGLLLIFEEASKLVCNEVPASDDALGFWLEDDSNILVARVAEEDSIVILDLPGLVKL